eukprot:TRINITY_DN77317_c0_g1_i1.p1 TRINITY_DN77317_c0_g1~~TRINITY_DN77317_c0_g1_i1.p1  ORF type:complete len:168 (-),score=32.43 TRINITY_DN77317_c0_g1_i1:139-642(-)
MAAQKGGFAEQLQRTAAEAAVSHLFSGKDDSAATGSMMSKILSGSSFDSLLGLVVLIYLAFFSIQTLLFTFRYSVYSLCVCCVLAVGEAGQFLTFGPFQGLSAFMTPSTKGFIYLACALGGVACFINISWNPLLLAGHIGVGFLGYKSLNKANAANASGGGDVESGI